MKSPKYEVIVADKIDNDGPPECNRGLNLHLKFIGCHSDMASGQAHKKRYPSPLPSSTLSFPHLSSPLLTWTGMRDAGAAVSLRYDMKNCSHKCVTALEA